MSVVATIISAVINKVISMAGDMLASIGLTGRREHKRQRELLRLMHDDYAHDLTNLNNMYIAIWNNPNSNVSDFPCYRELAFATWPTFRHQRWDTYLDNHPLQIDGSIRNRMLDQKDRLDTLVARQEKNTQRI